MPEPISNIPVPDPSILTTEQINRVTQSLRVEFLGQLTALREVLTTRFDANDKAIVLLAETVNRVPTLLDRETLRLSESFSEKLTSSVTLSAQHFSFIDNKFLERDAATEQRKNSTAVNVAAAFAAQKDYATAQEKYNDMAVAKAEASTVKQIEDLKSLFNSKNASTDEKIAINGERLTRIESLTRGMADQKDDQRASSNTGMQAVLLIITVISVMAAIATPFLHHS